MALSFEEKLQKRKLTFAMGFIGTIKSKEPGNDACL
jgi:hypothetical protein